VVDTPTGGIEEALAALEHYAAEVLGRFRAAA
jgi:hypothetical protein